MKEDIREMPAGTYYSKGRLIHRKAYTRNYGVKNPKRKYTPKPMRVMIEGRKYATQIYQGHFPEHKNYGDIKAIDAMALPEFDLLVGGFPCQSFSIAGKRGGFSDTRGTMFFEVARILKAKQPRLLLLENVKGLLSHDEGRTFATIIGTLDELGYDVQWQLCNSKDYGVPQNRERIIIVGHLRGYCRPEVFPLFGTDAEDTEARGDEPRGAQGIATRHLGRNGGLISPIASTIQVAEIPHVVVGTLRTHKDGEGFRESKSGMVPTIPARSREDGSGQAVIFQGGRGFNKGGKKDIAPAMGSNSWQDNNHLLEGSSIRRLTPIECERLQGFPDGWTEGVSDSQRYKTLGNAVTVNVIRAVMQRIL